MLASRTANPRVTAGFKYASLLPQAIETKTPTITASAHPVVITIHPLPSAFERLRSTPATTPSPSSTRNNVPRNSPTNGDVIQESPSDGRCLSESPPKRSLLHPIQRTGYRLPP